MGGLSDQYCSLKDHCGSIWVEVSISKKLVGESRQQSSLPSGRWYILNTDFWGCAIAACWWCDPLTPCWKWVPSSTTLGWLSVRNAAKKPKTLISTLKPSIHWDYAINLSLPLTDLFLAAFLFCSLFFLPYMKINTQIQLTFSYLCCL